MQTKIEKSKLTFSFLGEMNMEETTKIIDNIYRQLDYNKPKEIEFNLSNVSLLSSSFKDLMTAVKTNYSQSLFRIVEPIKN